MLPHGPSALLPRRTRQFFCEEVADDEGMSCKLLGKTTRIAQKRPAALIKDSKVLATPLLIGGHKSLLCGMTASTARELVGDPQSVLERELVHQASQFTSKPSCRSQIGSLLTQGQGQRSRRSCCILVSHLPCQADRWQLLLLLCSSCSASHLCCPADRWQLLLLLCPSTEQLVSSWCQPSLWRHDT